MEASKYWPHFLRRPLSMIAFSTALVAGQLLELADMMTTILQDTEDNRSVWSSFELTLWMRTSSEPSQGCLCVHMLVLFLYRKVTLSKMFHRFNFRCQLDQWKYFDTELLQINSISFLSIFSLCPKATQLVLKAEVKYVYWNARTIIILSHLFAYH